MRAMRKIPTAAAGVLLSLIPAAHAAPPVPVAESAQKMTVPPGYQVTLFAGEPDLVQPIGFTLDERGRLWVCENFSYPNGALEGKDRVVIYEDTDGDGKFNTKKVFADKFGYLTSALVGDGGVYVASAPWLLFIPDKDGDDKPDGPPVKLLEGFTWKGKHNVVNTLAWGPDGWLYGLHGITTPSRVGRPGAREEEKVDVGPGVWRYQPRTQKFEFIVEGTCNPWGLDWNDYGDAFISTSVMPHLYQVIPGAHYTRMFGQDFHKHVYVQMKECCDHLHWAGGDWTKSRDAVGPHGEAGGGHAHAGLLIYQGEMLPAGLRGSLLMCNIHGNRINRDTLSRKGSGWVASHAPDLLHANDKWFRGVTVHQGPDGGVFFSDWSDTGECHHYDNPATSTGRLYKLTYGARDKGQGTSQAVDLRKATDDQLVRMQLSRNEFHVRHARRLLAGRSRKPEVHAALVKMIDEAPEVPQKLRALWALHCTQGTTVAQLLDLTEHRNEYLRSWAVRLLADSGGEIPAGVLARFIAMAKDDRSPMVRLWLASALQRMPLEQRWDVVAALIAHAQDADDQYLPFMYWYAIEPLAKADSTRALKLAAASKVPKVRELVSRRVAAK